MMDIVSLTILPYVCPITREVKLNGHAEKISHKIENRVALCGSYHERGRNE